MGRPRAFDEAKILSAAVDAFWGRGYERTSTRDLVKFTGLNQSSLYNAFGDKRNIYRRALDYYLDHSVRERIRRLEQLQNPGMAISTFFFEVLSRTINDPLHRGCLLVNSALEVSGEDPDLHLAIATEVETIRVFFFDCLLAVSNQQDSNFSIDANKGASHLLSVLFGFRVLARITQDSEILIQAVAVALSNLNLPPVDFKGTLKQN